uniref:Uncharacterized protein n=1 Tax=Populus trichocarpa TaxID=3694 RepID=A0A2K1YV37_POPTR
MIFCGITRFKATTHVITSSHSISSAICGITIFNNDEISRHFEEVIELIFFHFSCFLLLLVNRKSGSWYQGIVSSFKPK